MYDHFYNGDSSVRNTVVNSHPALPPRFVVFSPMGTGGECARRWAVTNGA